jgi:hypothetical protein
MVVIDLPHSIAGMRGGRNRKPAAIPMLSARASFG